MQSGRRLYAVMVALAALTGTVVALALSGGPRLQLEGTRRPAPAGPSATETASPTPEPSPSVTPSPLPSGAASPAPTATPSEPLARVRPLVFAWRPAVTTVVIAADHDATTRLVAVSVDDGAATPLVDLPRGTEWRIRRDGSAVVFALPVGADGSRTRIAALNLRTGGLGWLTPDERSASQRSPLWSLDGSVVYYSRVSIDGTTDFGLFRIRVDGSNLTQLRPPSSDGPITITGVTPDGLGLVISRSDVTGLVDVFDLNTRAIRSFSARTYGVGERPSGKVDAWRPQRPRALVTISQPAGGPVLFVWDDLASPRPSPSPLLRMSGWTGDWDPDGARIVAAVDADAASRGPAGALAAPVTSTARTILVTVDPGGTNPKRLDGTEGAIQVFWLRAGIVYVTTEARDVRIVAPDGSSAPRTLYTSPDPIQVLDYVSP